MAEKKPFKGVIANWRLADEWGKNELRLHGMCVTHADYSNGITQGHLMTTSQVVAIWYDPSSKVRWCETKNSLYILV